MDKLSPNHYNKDQLPLYGRVYNPEAKKYEYTIGGVAVLMASRPPWEEVIELHEVKPASRYVWLGVQPAPEQAATSLAASK